MGRARSDAFTLHQTGLGTVPSPVKLYSVNGALVSAHNTGHRVLGTKLKVAKRYSFFRKDEIMFSKMRVKCEGNVTSQSVVMFFYVLRYSHV